MDITLDDLISALKPLFGADTPIDEPGEPPESLSDDDGVDADGDGADQDDASADAGEDVENDVDPIDAETGFATEPEPEVRGSGGADAVAELSARVDALSELVRSLAMTSQSTGPATRSISDYLVSR